MSKWYERGIFYHIYPLGLVGAPRAAGEAESGIKNEHAELLPKR